MGMEPNVTDEVISRQPPEAQAIIRDPLDRIAKLEAEVRQLRGQVKGKTPQIRPCRRVRSIRMPNRSGRNENRKGGAAASRVIRNMNER
jgi:hypothetical protein